MTHEPLTAAARALEARALAVTHDAEKQPAHDRPLWTMAAAAYSDAAAIVRTAAAELERTRAAAELADVAAEPPPGPVSELDAELRSSHLAELERDRRAEKAAAHELEDAGRYSEAAKHYERADELADELAAWAPVPRWRVTLRGDYGTFQLERTIELAAPAAEDAAEDAWPQTGIATTLEADGWTVSPVRGESWTVTPERIHQP